MFLHVATFAICYLQPCCLYTTYRCPPKIKSPVIYCLPLTVIHFNPDTGFKNSSNPLYFYQGSGALLACGLFWLKPDCGLQAVLVYISISLDMEQPPPIMSALPGSFSLGGQRRRATNEGTLMMIKNIVFVINFR